ncbi:PIN-like domain-containing protein [Jatrophihabitans sp. DSM 45814]
MPEEPFVFIDRSLGRIKVPELLRAGGIKLVTLAEHYGRPLDEDVNDPTWITDASQEDWILFMKDARIRRRPAEKEAIISSRARCFCLSDGNIGFAEMAHRYLTNWRAIVEASAIPGPFLYSVRLRGIVRLDVL